MINGMLVTAANIIDFLTYFAPRTDRYSAGMPKNKSTDTNALVLNNKEISVANKGHINNIAKSTASLFSLYD
jgi:hypothetical protein